LIDRKLGFHLLTPWHFI